MAEMDEEMEETYDEDDGVGAVDFLDLEIDFEYEYDAAKFFDFCRPESPLEARDAELWFETAGSYPPSPFIAKIDLGENNFGENVHIPPEFNNTANTSDITYSDDGSCIELLTAEETERGDVMEYESSKIRNYFSKDDAKILTKNSEVATRSTLMKPTASHLAKQNNPKSIKTKSRSLQRVKKSSAQNSEKSCMDVCDGADQEIKRQKLDDGHSRKVHDLKQQIQLVHKISQKKEHNDTTPGFRKLKITIPKEPDLGTARRAQRSRPGRSKEDIQDTLATTMFKARPLNRKILEAPSLPLHQRSTPRQPQFQEFHLKTSERAMHHASSSSSSSFQVRIDTVSRNRLQPHPSCSNIMHDGDCRRQELKREFSYSEPLSLNKKVLSAKGDVCSYYSKTRETKKPPEFNLMKEKRYHQALPIDLFNKMSLISEDRKNPTVELTSSHPSYGSKENITKVRGQDSKGLPSGKMRQKIIAGSWRQQSDHDLVNASCRWNAGIR